LPKPHITSRIVIKVNAERQGSLLPSSSQTACSSPPGDPLVSSTETFSSPTSSSPPQTMLPTNVPAVVAKKPLVEYDESDSDEDDESSVSEPAAGSDSLPSSSSSVGRPTSNLSSQLSSDDQDDVSSTSGDHEPSPVFVDDTKEDQEFTTEDLATKFSQHTSRKRPSEPPFGEKMEEDWNFPPDDFDRKRLRITDSEDGAEQIVTPSDKSA
uniref:DMP1 n=1 Tax=Gongylonema pulchrum TaxID=637853 RepID=A0A183D1J8_9BILA